jgi:hypothetical protein
MNMKYRLPRIPVAIEYQTIPAGRNPLLRRKVSRREEQFAHELCIFLCKVIRRLDMFARDDKYMSGRLGMDIAKCHNLIRLINYG